MKNSIGTITTVAAIALAACIPSVLGDDWPAYRHDVRRSGVSSEKFAMPLSEQWVFTPTFPPSHAWGDPQPKAVQGQKCVRCEEVFARPPASVYQCPKCKAEYRAFRSGAGGDPEP